MTWTDEAEKAAGAKHKTTVEIACTDETKCYADHPHETTDQYYDDRVTEATVERQVNIQDHDPISNDATLTLIDTDTEIGSDLDSSVYQGKETRLDSNFIDEGGAVNTLQLGAGTLDRRSIEVTDISFAIRPSLEEKLRLMQRVVSADAYPSAPVESFDRGLPIVFGTVATAANAYQRGVFAVNVPMIDGTANAQRLCLHQGYSCRNNTRHLYRRVGNTYTDLGVSGGGNWTITVCDADALGNRFTRALLAAGIHTPGAEYFCDLDGIPQFDDGYVTLDGANDYYTVTPANSPTLPGRTGQTGAFTFEVKIYPTRAIAAGTNEFIISIWNTAANGASWLLLRERATGKAWLYLSQDGTAIAYTARCDTTILAQNTLYTIRVAWAPGQSADIRINGVLQALTEGGASPTSIHPSTNVNFEMGRYPLGGYMQGRDYYGIIADGYQPLLAGYTSHRDQPLENVISWYNFDAAIGDDYIGENDLTPVSLAVAQYTYGVEERTPAWQALYALAYKEYCGMPYELINAGSFGTLALEQEADGWNQQGYCAGVAHWQSNGKGPDRCPDSRELLQEHLRCQDAVLFENNEGKLTVKSADISNWGTVQKSLTVDDITGDDVQIDHQPFELLNKTVAQYKINHSGGPEGNLPAQDVASQTVYGIVTEDTDLYYYFVRDVAYLKLLLNRQLLRRAGNPHKITLETPGLLMAQYDLGTRFDLTHPQILGGWTNKELYLSGLRVDPVNWITRVEGITVGDVYGPISYADAAGGEETEIIYPSADTFVFRWFPNNSYGSSTELWQAGWYFEDDARSVLRFAIPGVMANIISATLKIYVTSHQDFSGSPDNLALRQLLTITTWGNNSTWNNFENNGAGPAGWSETYIGGANLANEVSPNVGSKTFIFNAAGIAYLQAQIGGNAQFTFQRLEDYQYVHIASSEHGTSAYRPVLTIVYT